VGLSAGSGRRRKKNVTRLGCAKVLWPDPQKYGARLSQRLSRTISSSPRRRTGDAGGQPRGRVRRRRLRLRRKSFRDDGYPTDGVGSAPANGDRAGAGTWALFGRCTPKTPPGAEPMGPEKSRVIRRGRCAKRRRRNFITVRHCARSRGWGDRLGCFPRVTILKR